MNQLSRRGIVAQKTRMLSKKKLNLEGPSKGLGVQNSAPGSLGSAGIGDQVEKKGAQR